ncbi:MAG: Rrf2 family transcriptional regulator [Betaproteobacteria bacterium]|nr:Rrf2 family transcriptional regulator [Betaproteobacteria bacterium]
MRLTTKGRFAVTAALDLATNQAGGPVSLAEISARQKISLSYLEQLFGKLRRGGLVKSTRGPGGGYMLSRPAQDISVAEIITAVDESIDATSCGGQENCVEDQKCITHDLWEGLNEHIFTYLRAVTLAKLIDDSERRKQEAKGVHVIEVHSRGKADIPPNTNTITA